MQFGLYFFLADLNAMRGSQENWKFQRSLIRIIDELFVKKNLLIKFLKYFPEACSRLTLKESKKIFWKNTQKENKYLKTLKFSIKNQYQRPDAGFQGDFYHSQNLVGEAARKVFFLVARPLRPLVFTPPPPRLRSHRNFFPYIKEKVLFSLVAHPFSPPTTGDGGMKSASTSTWPSVHYLK